MKAFTVRRINDSDLNDFIRIRLEALRRHPDAFGASYEDWKQKAEAITFQRRCINNCESFRKITTKHFAHIFRS